MATMTNLEKRFYSQLISRGLPEPLLQFKFLDDRRYKADFAWPAIQLLVEVDGGTFSKGRHSRPTGRSNDCVRDIEALLAGFTTVRLTTDLVESGQGADLVQQVIDYLQSD